jgi:hypothetical protein
MESIEEAIERISELRDSGSISDEEYETIKKSLLAGIDDEEVKEVYTEHWAMVRMRATASSFKNEFESLLRKGKQVNSDTWFKVSTAVLAAIVLVLIVALDINATSADKAEALVDKAEERAVEVQIAHTIAHTNSLVEVPYLLSETVGFASEVGEIEGFVVLSIGVDVPSQPERLLGLIYEQYPAAGTEIEKGSVVVIKVSLQENEEPWTLLATTTTTTTTTRAQSSSSGRVQVDMWPFVDETTCTGVGVMTCTVAWGDYEGQRISCMSLGAVSAPRCIFWVPG